MKKYTFNQTPIPNNMKNLFFSQAYIDAHIDALQTLLPYASISDITYKNDQCASIQITQGDSTYLLFLPNALVNDYDNEDYADYNLILDSEYAESEKTFSKTFSNLIEITTFKF